LNYYRSCFISDMHLFSPVCKAEALHHFLGETEAKHWFLLGDSLDFWAAKRTHNYPLEHMVIVQKLLKKARHAMMWLFRGNHDDELRMFVGDELGNIKVVERMIYTTAGGKRYLLMHGDAFDFVIKHAVWLSKTGAVLYDWLIWMNHWYNKWRKFRGKPYWSLSAAVKKRVKEAVNYVSRFEQFLVDAAKSEGCDGVICGHIHTPAAGVIIDGIEYWNCGDWQESKTAIVEHEDGRLELLHFEAH